METQIYTKHMQGDRKPHNPMKINAFLAALQHLPVVRRKAMHPVLNWGLLLLMWLSQTSGNQIMANAIANLATHSSWLTL
jgi:hypothetical protein